jgi:hypothetical protein
MSFVKKNLLHQSLSKMLFPNPGRYQLRVEFTHRKSVNQQGQIDTIISNPIDIRIKGPQGADVLASQHFSKINLLYQGNSLGEIVQAQQNFVNNFPNSVYRKFVAFDLANNYERLKDYEKAEREFYEISDIDFFYSEEVKRSLVELTGKLKRPNPRSKRPVVITPIPFSTPVERPAPHPVPYPSNGPVMIPNPNANPNATPIRKPD